MAQAVTAALWEAGCRSVRRSEIGMGVCEVVVASRGRPASDPKGVKGAPETDPLGMAEGVKSEGEACAMALPAEGAPWAAWGHVVEAAGTESQTERVAEAEACPAEGNGARVAFAPQTG